jgi:biopolymer transport protein ExbD
MAKRRIAGSGTGEVNMTPMIDCTFQLIIFFILTAQMASEQAKVLVPEPQVSQALSEADGSVMPSRVTVNIVGKYGDKGDEDERESIVATHAEHFQVGAEKIELDETGRLVEILTERLVLAGQRGIKAEDFYVEIRGDRDITFGQVVPVLEAAAMAKIKKMCITAIVGKNVKKIKP